MGDDANNLTMEAIFESLGGHESDGESGIHLAMGGGDTPGGGDEGASAVTAVGVVDGDHVGDKTR